jgi:diadenosine tetraphosphate (Ap4A) HIT family hydrolase
VVTQKCLFCELPADRILLKKEVCTLSLCLGPLRVGHALIISNFHINSFAKLDRTELIAFQKFRNKIKQIYLNNFGSFLFFEHGNHSIIENSFHSHAHLHIIPISVKNKILDLLEVHNPSVRLSDYSVETTKWINNREYLFYENSDDNQLGFYIFSKWPRKQFVRHLVMMASDYKNTEVDWEVDPRFDVMDETVRVLKPILGGTND